MKDVVILKLLENIKNLQEKDLNVLKKIDYITFVSSKEKASALGMLKCYIISIDPLIDFEELDSFVQNNPEINDENILKLIQNLANKRILNKTLKKIHDSLLRLMNEKQLSRYFLVYLTYNKKNELILKYRDLFKVSRLLDAIEDFSSMVDTVNLLINFENDYQHRIKVLTKFLEEIKNFEDKPFFDINKDVINVIDPALMNIIYEFIIDYQLKEGEALNSKNNSQDFKNSLENLLVKHKISLNSFNNIEKIVKYGNLANIEAILTTFSKATIDISLFDSETFSDILIFTDPKNLDYLMVLLNKKIIDVKFIYQNPGIFLSETSTYKDLFIEKPSFEKILANFNLLSTLNLDFSKHYNNEILLMDKKILLTNSKTLMEYKTVLKNKKLWCSLLFNANLFKLIDFFEENGINYSHINFDNISLDIDINFLIKRLYLALNCNIPLFKNNMIDLDILNKIKNKDLDEYIPSETNYHIPIDILEEFKKNKFNGFIQETDSLIDFKEFNQSHDGNIYFGDNIIISKTKVMRNFSIIYHKNDKYSINDLIFYALIYDSFLNKNEIDQIKNCIEKNGLNKK